MSADKLLYFPSFHFLANPFDRSCASLKTTKRQDEIYNQEGYILALGRAFMCFFMVHLFPRHISVQFNIPCSHENFQYFYDLVFTLLLVFIGSGTSSCPPAYMYYGENIAPNTLDENYRTPQSIPSIKPKSSQYTSIRPSPQSAVSPVSNFKRGTPEGLRAVLSQQSNHHFEYPPEVASNVTADSEVANAFRSQVLQACAESSGVDISGFDFRRDPSYTTLDMPYIPSSEFSYQPAAEASSFQHMMEVPYAPELVHHQSQNEASDVAESFRQQVLAACTRVALESWLDDATPDRPWTPLETRLISPVVLNSEVNRKLASSMHYPAVVVALTSQPEYPQPVFEAPKSVVKSVKQSPLGVPAMIPEEPLESPHRPKAVMISTLAVEEPSLPPNNLVIPTSQVEEPVESPRVPLERITSPLEMPAISLSPAKDQLVADIPPLTDYKAAYNTQSPSVKLARSESIVDNEPLSPVRDSIRLLEKTSERKAMTFTPGSIKRKMKESGVAEEPKVQKPADVQKLSETIPIDTQQHNPSDENIFANNQPNESIGTFWDELGVAPPAGDFNFNGVTQFVVPESAEESPRYVMSPAMREQHSLLIDELKFHFSSRKDSVLVEDQQDFNVPQIVELTAQSVYPIGGERYDITESKENSLGEIVQALNFTHESKQEQSGQEIVNPKSLGMKGHPSQTSLASGTFPPPSLQPLTDPDRPASHQAIKTPVKRRKPLFVCCCQ